MKDHYSTSYLRLRRIVEENDTREGRIFSLTIQALIFLSLITFCIDTLPDLSERSKRILWWIELFTVGIFTLEYILRIVVAERKSRYIFSFYGLVDLLAILPFYLATGLDLRSLRVLRFLRLFRILKIFRYNKAMRRFKEGFLQIKEELVVFLIGCGILFFISSVGIYYFEKDAQPEAFSSIFDSMWWSVITLTTVGYGDVYPVTVGGKIFTFVILVIGLGVVAVPAGLIASSMQEILKRKGRE